MCSSKGKSLRGCLMLQETVFRSGVLKLWNPPFLMEFGFLNLEFGNQIWKFMCSYYDKFSGQFSKIANFLEFEFSND